MTRAICGTRRANQSHKADVNLLIAGSFSSKASDPDVSGTVISLKQLVAQLQAKPGLSLDLVDTSGVRKGGVILGTFRSVQDIWRKSKNADALFLNLSPDGFAALCLPCVLISRLRGVPLIFRMFGGRDIGELKFLRRLIALRALHWVDVYFAQTRDLIAAAEKRGLRNVEWFPTTRPMVDYPDGNPHVDSHSAYVTLTQLKPAKGIFELIQAAKLLGSDFQFNVYGPFYHGLDESIFNGLENVHYKGVARPEQVPEILRNSKALVFPTYLHQEGYSGVIIESYSVGLPVLCSRWKALPEIVDERSGILFEPRDVASLCAALKRFHYDQNLQRRLSNGAFERRLDFAIETAEKRVMKVLERLNCKVPSTQTEIGNS